MADHVRKQLRTALATRLTGLTTTSTRVHGYRVDPLQISELPALSVEVLGDEVEDITVHGPAQQERVVEVHVKGIAGTVGIPDDTLDLIAKEVEIALATVLTVASKSVQMHYRRCQIEFSDGEKVAGVIDMEFVAKLFTVANAPDVLS
jgi:hypothetical protein